MDDGGAGRGRPGGTGRPRPAVSRRVVLGGLGLVLFAAACDTRPSWERQALGRSYFDSTGAYVHAGVSTRTNADIRPLRPSTLGSDVERRPYRLYEMRCGSCHDAPDPDMKTGEHWSFLVRRMQDKTGTAGLIPMTDAEADTILAFLRKHGR